MILKKYLKNFSLAFSYAVVLSGCANQPREVKANINLVPVVKESTPDNLISEQYWSRLSNPIEMELNHPYLNIELGPLYISALGQQCRSLLILTPPMNNVRVACAIGTQSATSPQQWYLNNTVVQDTSELTL